ncbi:MAG: hypothetical protein JJU31_07940 [Wenzhouxiangella sp.]|nr:hypothetical protein [Wenzhouxiangella sp.]MCH8477110.1 hypothetical protein [Wenzhouxiangella sp.]
MNEIQNRFEYRAFAASFGLIESRLRQWGGEPMIRESAEVYLVAAGRHDQNIKVRNDQLDIKQLVAEKSGFQQWAPRGKWSFPLDQEAYQALSAALGTELSESGIKSTDSLIEHFRGHRQVVIVDLFKRRFGFEIGNCQAELAEVTINGAALKTACVESTDLAAARELSEQLGLAAYPNTSYIDALMRVTGLTR